MSSLRFAILAVGLSVLAGCPEQPKTQICAGTGILCPEGTYCGAVQPICLTTSCGNGIVDPNEQCDDGNILEGDTCSPICKREECGNSVLDPGEICDDGNKANGDGCAATCMSKETCGNGIVDVGEACDDANTINADGCSGTPIMVSNESSPDPCKSTEVCGNGIKDIQVGEVCDDGNTVSGDGCNSDCRSGEGCGNGILDPGEQCDDGNANNNDDCLDSCKIAKCGDGIIDNTGTHGEQCDAGTTGAPVETATCNIDCTTRACGDGKVNQTAGEQCDNGIGNNADTKNCTMSCLLNICGDGRVDMQPPGIEQCDDGNQNNTDGCSNACALASCGNSTVDTGEMCDDGNTDQTDACVMCHTAICGDGFTRVGVEQCDDGGNANGDGCSSSCRSEICGNGILDVNEECDDGNTSNTDACTNSCGIAVCGDTFTRAGVEQCDDGNTMNNDGCSSTCRFEGCGNGILDQGEQCDDNNTVSGDGCSSTCQFEACGDGFVNNGEQCDGNGAGVGGETASCNGDCTTASCGDAKTNATRGEQCDAGAGLNADNRDCTAMCKINVCTDGKRDTLGPLHFEACDDGNTINTDGCNNSCTLASCGNGLLDPGEQCDDNNNVNSDACVNCQNALCGDGVVETGVEECDGTSGCSAECRFQVCGNGIIDPGEQCDDGNLVNGDGCSGVDRAPVVGPPAIPGLLKCKFEFCGDGLKGTSETCDKTAPGMLASCNRDCTQAMCGDGKFNSDANEQCDLGSAVNGTNQGCSATCQLEHCGDNVIDANEVCDNSSANNVVAGPCLPWCQPAVCGDGVVQANSWLSGTQGTGTVAAEQCDDGPSNGATQCAYGETSCTRCSSTCQTQTFNTAGTTHYCGDNNVDNTGGDTEVCDNGTANGVTTCPYNTSCMVCSYDCKTVTSPTVHVCGDGAVDGPTEKCDFGATNNTTTLPTSCPYNSSCTTCPAGCASPTVVVSGGRCGDGIPNTTPATGMNPVGTEMCDLGAANTTDVDCPWAATALASMCTRCSTTCTPLTTVPHYCGDGQCDLGFETPGGCTADCGTGLFALTVVKTGAGDGSVTSAPAGITCSSGSCSSASANFAAATMVTLTAAPNGSSTFIGWGGACMAAGASTTCMVTMSAALTATANFASIQRQVTVTKTGSGAGVGSVTVIPAGTACGAGCSSYDDGTVVVITATPGANNSVSWSGCDSTVGDVCIVTANGTEAVTAMFTLAQFPLMMTVVGAGTVTSSPAGISCPGTCTASFNAGTTVTLTATPDAAGVFNGFTGDCTTASCLVNAAKNVTATFTP